jgi:hypothetical protein
MDDLSHTLERRRPTPRFTLNRVALGLFFAISGGHKLFNLPARDADTNAARRRRAVPIT